MNRAAALQESHARFAQKMVLRYRLISKHNGKTYVKAAVTRVLKTTEDNLAFWNRQLERGGLGAPLATATVLDLEWAWRRYDAYRRELDGHYFQQGWVEAEAGKPLPTFTGDELPEFVAEFTAGWQAWGEHGQGAPLHPDMPVGVAALRHLAAEAV